MASSPCLQRPATMRIPSPNTIARATRPSTVKASPKRRIGFHVEGLSISPRSRRSRRSKPSKSPDELRPASRSPETLSSTQRKGFRKSPTVKANKSLVKVLGWKKTFSDALTDNSNRRQISSIETKEDAESPELYPSELRMKRSDSLEEVQLKLNSFLDIQDEISNHFTELNAKFRTARGKCNRLLDKAQKQASACIQLLTFAKNNSRAKHWENGTVKDRWQYLRKKETFRIETEKNRTMLDQKSTVSTPETPENEPSVVSNKFSPKFENSKTIGINPKIKKCISLQNRPHTIWREYKVGLPMSALQDDWRKYE